MHPILANAAIPVVSVACPRLFWLLPAVIVFEFLVAKRNFAATSERALIAISVANIISTLAGAAFLGGICLAFASGGSSHGMYDKLGFAFWLYDGITTSGLR